MFGFVKKILSSSQAQPIMSSAENGRPGFDVEDEEGEEGIEEQDEIESQFQAQTSIEEDPEEDEDPGVQLRRESIHNITHSFDGAGDEKPVSRPKPKRKRASKKSIPDEEVAGDPKPTKKRSRKSQEEVEPPENAHNGDGDVEEAMAEPRPKPKRSRTKAAPRRDLYDVPNTQEEAVEDSKSKTKRSRNKAIQEAFHEDMPNSEDEEVMEDLKPKSKRSRNSSGAALKKRKTKKLDIGVASDDYEEDSATERELAMKERRKSNRSNKSSKSMAIDIPLEEPENEEMVQVSNAKRSQKQSSKVVKASSPQNQEERPNDRGPEDIVAFSMLAEEDVHVDALQAATQASLKKLEEQTAGIDPDMTVAERRQELKRLERNHLSRVAKARKRLAASAACQKDDEEMPDAPHESPGPVAARQGSVQSSLSSFVSTSRKTSMRAAAHRSMDPVTPATNHLSDAEDDEEPIRPAAKAPGKRNIIPEADEEDEPQRPSAKALGKRKAVEEKPKSASRTKRAKTIKYNGPPSRDLRTMFTPTDARSRSQAFDTPPSYGLAAVAVGMWNGERAAPAQDEASSINSFLEPSADRSPSGYGTTSRSKRTRASGSAVQGGPSKLIDPDEFDFQADETREPESDLEIISKSSEHRKRRLPVDDTTPSHSISKDSNRLVSNKPKGKVAKTPKEKRRYSGATPGSRSTTLTFKESQSITSAVESYGQRNDLTQFQVNAIVQQNFKLGSQTAEAKKFWEYVHEQVPEIPQAKVTFMCRRKFHNFEARGSWTKEQDEELRVVYEDHPKKWADIGRIINRHPEDVRDRWRNYLICGDNLRRDRWEDDEVEQLKDVVAECILKIRAGLQHEAQSVTSKHLESLLDWSEVSAKMEFTRSRLQCSTKWKTLKSKRESDDENEGVRSANKKLTFPKRNPTNKSTRDIDDSDVVEHHDEDHDSASKKKKKMSIGSKQTSISESKQRSKVSPEIVLSDDGSGEGSSTAVKKPAKKQNSFPKSTPASKKNVKLVKIPKAVKAAAIEDSSEGPSTSTKKNFRKRMQRAGQASQESMNKPHASICVDEVAASLKSLKYDPVRGANFSLKAPKRSKILSEEKVVESDSEEQEHIQKPKINIRAPRRGRPRREDTVLESEAPEDTLANCHISAGGDLDIDEGIAASTEVDDGPELESEQGSALGSFQANLQSRKRAIIREREGQSRSLDSDSVDLDDDTPIRTNSFRYTSSHERHDENGGDVIMENDGWDLDQEEALDGEVGDDAMVQPPYRDAEAVEEDEEDAGSGLPNGYHHDGENGYEGYHHDQKNDYEDETELSNGYHHDEGSDAEEPRYKNSQKRDITPYRKGHCESESDAEELMAEHEDMETSLHDTESVDLDTPPATTALDMMKNSVNRYHSSASESENESGSGSSSADSDVSSIPAIPRSRAREVSVEL